MSTHPPLPDRSTSSEAAREVPVVQAKLISGVKECDWEHFVNRFSSDEPIHAIDILISGSQLERNMAAEESKRLRSGAQHWKASEPRESKQIHTIQSNSRSIHRVRVRSQKLLAVFGDLTGHAWGDEPHTFMRPFQYLVQNHDKFKAHLQHLESEIVEASPKDVQVPCDDEVLDHLRCYITLAEEKLLPPYKVLHETSGSTNQQVKIRFDDLPHLFKPGELVLVSPTARAESVKEELRTAKMAVQRRKESPQELGTHQKIWRFRTGYVMRKHEINDHDTDEFVAYCYYIGYDGTSWGAVESPFWIMRFPGERNVTELGLYPLRFADSCSQILHQHMKHGRLVVRSLSSPGWHMSCEGWSLTTDPSGFPILDYSRSHGGHTEQKRAEFIEGQVIVDFREACNSDAQYAENFFDLDENMSYYPKSNQPMEYHSPIEITTWSDYQRSHLLYQSHEVLVLSDHGFTPQEQDRYAEQDPYLRQTTWPQQAPEGENLALLPLRVFVYALRKRKFVPIDVRHLTAIPVETGAFEHLQLPATHKNIIQAAVNSHLRRQRIERRIQKAGGPRPKAQDFIPGKGRGLLIMMHGEPGVGKTATAEAVAQLTQRPLLPISCSDIPMHRIEDMLEEIFRLAHLWDCVLLMDEADVILSTRSNVQAGYNAHQVSTFLKMLEYYNGILMLTTNRAGKLDPAMSSRIHVILHYKRLGHAEIREVFRINIDRLRQAEKQQHEASGEHRLVIAEPSVMEFVDKHCAKHPKGKGAWNGRQIRNAFMVAAALARQQAEQPGLDADFQVQLWGHHFQEVEKLIDDYDGFRAQLIGGDDSHAARMKEERDDDYDEDSHVGIVQDERALNLFREITRRQN